MGHYKNNKLIVGGPILYMYIMCTPGYKPTKIIPAPPKKTLKKNRTPLIYRSRIHVFTGFSRASNRRTWKTFLHIKRAINFTKVSLISPQICTKSVNLCMCLIVLNHINNGYKMTYIPLFEVLLANLKLNWKLNMLILLQYILEIRTNLTLMR